MCIRKIEINRIANFIFTFLLTLSFFYPAEYFTNAVYVIRMATIALAGGYAFLVIAYAVMGRIVISKEIVLSGLYFLVLLLSSWINSVEYATLASIFSIARFLAFAVYIDYAIKRDERLIVNALFLAIAIIVIWDICGIITNPLGIYLGGRVYDGVYKEHSEWLFGNKNNHATFFLLYLLLSFWKYRCKPNVLNTLLVVISVFATVSASLILSSSTSIIVLFVSIAGIVLYLINSKRRQFLGKRIVGISGKTVLKVYLLINVLFFAGLTGFLNPIVSMFGKDITFSNRTNIWEAAITLFVDKPIFGQGNVDSQFLVNALGTIGSVNAHNQILDTAIRGGVILLIVLFMLLQQIAKDMDGCISYRDKIVMAFFFFAVLIKMIFEQELSSYVAWVFLMLVANYGILHGSKSEDFDAIEKLEDL